MDKNLIIIAAASLGRRMKTSGPKAAIKISENETVIERQINIFKRHFPEFKIVVVSGAAPDKMKKIVGERAEVVVNKEFETTNTAFSISIALEKHKCDNLIFSCGDLVFNDNLINQLDLNFSSLILDNNKEYRTKEVGCAIYNDNFKIDHVNYGINPKWAQIAFMKKEEVLLLKTILKSERTKRWFAFELINKIIDMGGSFYVNEPRGGAVVEIDSHQDIVRAKEFVKTGKIV